MNTFYWRIRHVHEAKTIEEAAELLNSGWVIIQIAKRKDAPYSLICATPQDVDMAALFGDI